MKRRKLGKYQEWIEQVKLDICEKDWNAKIKHDYFDYITLIQNGQPKLSTPLSSHWEARLEDCNGTASDRSSMWTHLQHNQAWTVQTEIPVLFIPYKDSFRNCTAVIMCTVTGL